MSKTPCIILKLRKGTKLEKGVYKQQQNLFLLLSENFKNMHF